MLLESFRIPFTAGGCKEVPTVNVDRTGMARDGIGDCMADVVAKRDNVARRQSSCPERLNSRSTLGAQTPPEDVVLSTRVHTDHRPRAMIVRGDGKVGRPRDVQDRKMARPMKLPGFRLAQGLRYCRPVGHRARQDLPHVLGPRTVPDRHLTITNETIKVEHGMILFKPWTLSL